MQNYKSFLRVGSLLGLTLLSSAVLTAPNVNADTSSTVDVTVNVPAACTLTATNNNLVKTINPGTFDTIGTANLKAVCNDPDGFAIYAIGYTDNMHGNNYLTTDLGDDYKIATGTAESGDTSNWSMTIGNNANVSDNYTATINNGFDEAHEVPNINTKIATVTSVTDQSIGTNLTAQFDAYIASTQASGSYQGKVKFTLVHPNTNAPVLQMQNVDEWGDSVEIGQTVYAVDTRDGEGYTVARLADGSLWMTQNLRLNLETANITTDNTNRPTEDFLNTVNAETKPAPNNDETWCTEQTSDCIDQIQYSTINIGDTTADPAGHTYDEYGVYYNWYTATAGNGTFQMPSTISSGDICPKGWRLSNAGVASDIYNLVTALGGIGSRMNSSTDPTGAWMSSVLQSAPINYTLSGRILNGELITRGTATSYWTATTNASSSVAAVLSISNTTVIPGINTNSRANGLPIRCIYNDYEKYDTLLDIGSSVGVKMKSLAAGEPKGVYDQSEEIKAIRMADSLPNDFVATDSNTISSLYSKHPVYIFFDNTNDAGIMYVYSGGYRVTMNPNSTMMFFENTSLSDISGLADWDTSKVRNMFALFYNATSLVDATPIADWDTSNVMNMSNMFFGTSSMTSIDLSRWNTSKVESTSSMFDKASSLASIDLSNWDTSNLTNTSFMFNQAHSLTSVNVSNWDTSNVINMNAMFQVGANHIGNGQLTEIIGLEDWDTSNVTNMGWMFYGAGNMTNYDGIADWNVSKVESMNHMFCDNFSLESLDLSRWNVSSVKTMYDMFDDARLLTTIGDVSHWNTANLIDVGGWLNGASSFVGNNGTLDLSGWNTSNLKAAGEMLRATKLQTVDLSSWTFASITNDPWDGAGSGIYQETGNTSGYKGLAGMFLNMPQLQTVYVSQSGLNSYNDAVTRGIDITNMWSGSNISSFTVKP